MNKSYTPVTTCVSIIHTYVKVHMQSSQKSSVAISPAKPLRLRFLQVKFTLAITVLKSGQSPTSIRQFT